MSKYILYTYQFSPLQKKTENNMFESNKEVLTQDELMVQKQDIFGAFFRETFTPLFKKQNKKFDHKIILNENNIIVFRLANNKKLYLEESFHKQEYRYSPSCLIIIDNRKDVQRIAIEEDKVAFSDTNAVKQILLFSFKRYLNNKGLDITIQRDYEQVEFWNIIHTYKQKIEMVRFHFSYPNLPCVNKSIKEVIATTNRATNSKQSSFELKAADGEHLEINEENQEIADMAAYSAECGDIITIKAKGIRAYLKTGTTTKGFECDNLEASLSGDLFNSGFEALIEKLNKFLRI